MLYTSKSSVLNNRKRLVQEEKKNNVWRTQKAIFVTYNFASASTSAFLTEDITLTSLTLPKQMAPSLNRKT